MSKEFGSTWRKWDLHVHTPYSLLNNGFGDDFEYYAKKLFKAAFIHQVQVIGVTDYFGIWGYRTLREIQEDNLARLQLEPDEHEFAKQILLLPNIEFRLDFIVGSHRVNFHVIFSDEVDCDDIENHFLNELQVLYEGNPQGLDEERKLCMRTLESLGKDLKKEHRDFTGSDAEIGMRTAFVSCKQISETLVKQPSLFKNRYLIGVVADEDLSQISWDSSAHLSRKILIQKSDFLFASNPKTVKWGLGEIGYDAPTEFCNEFKSLKPCIHGSDAHRADDLFRPNHNRFCWIKADSTFEGLKQILYEPKYRVHIGAEPPPNPIHKIETVSFEFPDEVEIENKEDAKRDKFCFAGNHDFSFSPNYTCLIGGRGTGKSTLLNLIDQRLSQGENVFFASHRLSDGGEIIDLNECVKIDDDENKYVEFLSQNEIEEFALDQKRFSDAIYHRIERLDNDKSLSDLREQLRKYHESIDAQIERIKTIHKTNYRISECEREKKSCEKLTQSFSAPEFTEMRQKLKELTDQIKSIQKSKEKLYRLADDLNKLIADEYFFDEPDNQYERAYRSLVDDIRKRVNVINDENAYVETEKILKEKTLEAERLKEGLVQFLHERGLSPENISDVANASERSTALDAELKVLQAQVEALKKGIASFQISSEIRTQYEDKIRTLIKPLREKLEGVNSQHVRGIGLEYFFDEETAKKDLLELVFKLVSDSDSGNNYKKHVFEEILYSTDPQSVSNQQLFLQSMREKERATKTTDGLCEYFTDTANFAEYKLLIEKIFSDVNKYKSVRVSYDEKPLAHTSFGQRCTAAIVVLLLIGNTPIIIDEPEAHLDSALISQYLIDLIKAKKTERQVIFATHNANFVINGDAELVHILENEDGKTKVTSTTIENMENRESLLALEGGAEAFQIRGRKYAVRGS